MMDNSVLWKALEENANLEEPVFKRTVKEINYCIIDL
jgi:hypothetical protein